MQSLLKRIQSGAAVLTVAIMLAGALPSVDAFAQTAAPAQSSTALSEPTIKALQEALNKQGIAVKADGVLSDETRAAVRTYQSQHHLPVTGEPDKATLDKLGVRQSAAPAQSSTLAQATPLRPAGSPSAQAQAPTMPAPQTPMQPSQLQGGMMMNCPMMGQTQGQMMQGQMQAMMQMMQGMMQMMQSMQGQPQGGQTQGGMMMMNRPMMREQAMMQMMQGMMQMMQSMQGQMQPGQMQPSPR